MTEETQKFAAVLDGYSLMAKELREDWVPYLEQLATRLGSPKTGPAEVAEEFPAFAKLVADSVSRVIGEAGDAVAILSKPFENSVTITVTDDAERKAEVVLTLTVEADLRGMTGAVLPTEAITVVPGELPPGETGFDLVVDEADFAADLYGGFVVATAPDGHVVWRKKVTVPIS